MVDKPAVSKARQGPRRSLDEVKASSIEKVASATRRGRMTQPRDEEIPPSYTYCYNAAMPCDPHDPFLEPDD
jgi:hypothetical protein